MKTAGHERPAIFLDRDGVIVENRSDYIKSTAEVAFLPGAFEALRKLAETDFRVVLVTNQSSVGRGILSLREAEGIHSTIVRTIRSNGGRVDASYLCPHHPEDACTCRKPAPGMLLEAAAELNINLSQSCIIGDAVTDLQAGWAAGTSAVLVLTGRGTAQAKFLTEDDKRRSCIVANLGQAVNAVLNRPDREK